MRDKRVKDGTRQNFTDRLAVGNCGRARMIFLLCLPTALRSVNWISKFTDRVAVGKSPQFSGFCGKFIPL